MKKLNTVIITFVLLALSSTLEFQSYGDFTRPQLSQIIESVQRTLEDSSPNKAKTLSDQLNALMDPSWFVIYMDKSNNFQNILVVYGYAFKNHWMWLSNFVGGKSVVLWKDYNCDQYVENSIADYNTNTIPSISDFNFNSNALEIEGMNNLKLLSELTPQYLGEGWKMVFDIVTALNNNQNGYAYTGFGVQLPSEDIAIPEFSYSVCKKREEYDTLLIYQVKIRDYKGSIGAKGFLMLMRTR